MFSSLKGGDEATLIWNLEEPGGRHIQKHLAGPMPAHLGILRHEHPGTGTASTASSLVPVPVDYSDCLGAVGQKKGEACTQAQK